MEISSTVEHHYMNFRGSSKMFIIIRSFILTVASYISVKVSGDLKVVRIKQYFV